MAILSPPETSPELHPTEQPGRFSRLWRALTGWLWKLIKWFFKPLPTEEAPDYRPSLFSRERWQPRLPDLLVLLPLLVFVFWVHWRGFEGWPFRLNGDAGIYASQTWAVVFHHALAPFTYFYDHPPGAWLTMALYAFVTRAFQRDPTTLIAVREAMLVFHIISSAFLFGVARRLGYRRGFAVLAVLLFSLSPLGLQYQREAFIDNVVVMWLLAGLFYLASRRRGLPSAVGAGFCFGMAILSKETALAMLPGILVFFWLNTDRRRLVDVFQRIMCFTIPLGGMVVIYFVYAFCKHEFMPGRGHVSLVGTFKWQLVNRKPTGNLLNVHSQTFAMAMTWVHQDPVILLATLAFIPLALLNRRTLAFAVMLLFQIATVCHNGYMPYAFVTLFFPLCGLMVAGVLDNFWSGFKRRRERRDPASRKPLARWMSVAAIVSLRLVILAGIAGTTWYAYPVWQPQLAQAMDAQPDLAVKHAVAYMVTHIPKHTLIVTDNDSWTDVAQAGYHPAPVDKLELDPAVRERLDHGWRDIQWVLAGKFSPGDDRTYPITATAIAHARVVAQWGSGDSKLYLWKVIPGKT